MFWAYTRPSYQVSVYRTIGPLVAFIWNVFFTSCTLFVVQFTLDSTKMSKIECIANMHFVPHGLFNY